MKLATRVIPVMLERGGHLVKGVGFRSWRSVGNATQAARIHSKRGVDELIYLDIGATPAGKMVSTRQVERLTTGMFHPITVGGGVRHPEDIQTLLNAGADKVAIGSAALDTESLIKRAASRYGSQAITVAIDYSMNMVYGGCGAWYRNQTPDNYARHVEQQGAGEILLTNIDRDGTMKGYDLQMIEKVARAVSIPVIAAGGCGSYEDMVSAVNAGASAVAAGALFLFTDATPAGAAQFLSEHGIEARVNTKQE